MLNVKPNKYYRILYTDRSEVDFQAINVPTALHLIEVKTKDKHKCKLIDLLAEKKWLDVFEIVKEVAKV